jgi:hypothetical protein
MAPTFLSFKVQNQNFTALHPSIGAFDHPERLLPELSLHFPFAAFSCFEGFVES